MSHDDLYYFKIIPGINFTNNITYPKINMPCSLNTKLGQLFSDPWLYLGNVSSYIACNNSISSHFCCSWTFMWLFCMNCTCSYLNSYLLICCLWAMLFKNRQEANWRFVEERGGWEGEKCFGSMRLLRSLTNISIEHFSERKGDGCCRLSSPFIFYGYLFTDDVGRLCAERKHG